MPFDIQDTASAGGTPSLQSQPAADAQTPSPSQSSDTQPAATTPATPNATAPTMDHVKMRVADAIGVGYTPDEIVNHMATLPGPVGEQTRAALKWNYSPAEIIDHVNPDTSEGSLQGVPILAPIQRGIASAQKGVANLADDVGFHGVASDIRGRINQEAAQAPSSAADMSAQLHAGNYGAALADIPSAALEGTLPVAAGLATGALTGGAAPVTALAARLAGGAVTGGATQGDAIARARAANNGEAAPSASDVALGVLGGGVTGAAGSLGLGGVGKGVAGAVGQALAHAGGDAAQPELQALAGSVGTAAGTQNASRADMTAAALTGLGGRIGLAAPEALNAAAKLTPSGRTTAQANAYAAMSPDDQRQVENVVAAHQAMQDVTAGALGTSAAKPRQAAATASDGIYRDVGRLVGTLGQQGVIDGNDGQVIGAAMNAARSRGAVLTQDHLDAIDGLGLKDDDATALKNVAVQMNLLSDPDSLKASTGPFQGVLQVLGSHYGGAAVGGLLGGAGGASLGYLVGGAVRPVIRGALGRLGSVLDGVTGFGKTPLQQSADDNRSLLTAAGVSVPNASDDLQAAAVRTRSAIAQQRALLAGGLSPTLQTAATRSAIAPMLSQAANDGSTAAIQAPDPVAAAVARAAAQNPSAAVVGGSGGSSAVGSPGGSQGPATYSPDTSGLSPEALAQAQRLPQWVYGLGANLQDALHVSGQARPVNMAGEVNDALNSLQGKGWLPDDIAEGLKSHSGRIVPQLYELLRNEMLLRNGIDRTVGDTGSNVVPMTAGVTGRQVGGGLNVAAQ